MKLNGRIVIFNTNDSSYRFQVTYEALSALYPKDKIETVTLYDDAYDALDPDRTALAVLPDVEVVSAQLRDALDIYLNHGGGALMMGGPAFDDLSYLSGGKLVDLHTYLHDEYKKLSDAEKKMIFDTSDASVLNSFERLTHEEAASSVEYSFGDFGLVGAGSYQMRVRYENCKTDGWIFDYFRYGTVSAAPSFNAIGFWARSDESDFTRFVAAEIGDTNGTRWKARFELTEKWEYYILDAKNFTYYSGVRPEQKNPTLSQITSVGFGIINSVCETTRGDHTYYLSDVELLSMNTDLLNCTREIRINGVSPSNYRQYPITNAAKVNTYPRQVLISDRDYVLGERLIAGMVGVQATGYKKSRACRFIPLIEVRDEKDMQSGYIAWVDVYLTGARKGAVVGYFSAVSDDFYNKDGMEAIREVASAMTRGLFLTEGGTDEYRYIPADQPTVELGASYVDLSGSYDRDVVLSTELYAGTELLKPCNALLSGETVTVSDTFDLTRGRPDRAVTTLTLDGQVIDCIEHMICYWEAKPLSERKYFYTQDGYYMRDGQRINLVGTNYAPTFVSSMIFPDCDVKRQYYDPYVIREDLLRVKELGMNAVSLNLHACDCTESNNMLDIVCVCEDLGIYVDLAIRSSHAYDYDAEFVYYSKADADNLIKRMHFDENDNIVAYDICWERRIGRYDRPEWFGLCRNRWDADWAEWIVTQYGSVEHAEELWGCKVNRKEDGSIRGVTDAELNEGKESKKLAAYYRFEEDMSAKEFSELREYLRSVDGGHHLISFRMQCAGSGTRVPEEGNYDFQGLATTMDFMSPEGYAILGLDDVNLKQLPFMAAYARYCKPDAPVLMKEFGVSQWTGSNFNDPHHKKRVYAKEYFDKFLEHMYNSDILSFYMWYFLTSYRVGENSDYGLFEPDGSDRLSTGVFRKWIPKFKEKTELCADVYTITLEKEDCGRGLTGMYEAAFDEVCRAYSEGKRIVLLNKKQSEDGGIFYADTTLDSALGSTEACGKYPLRYVNGQIISVSGDEDTLKIEVCNCGHAAWRAGTVSVISTEGSDGRITPTVIPEDVEYLGRTTVTVPINKKGPISLRLSVNGVEFGHLFKHNI